MIEKIFNISFVANLALREKQIQQNYRPVIAVHKWFARRPGSLFRGLLLSEFGTGDIEDIYYQSNSLTGITVADPFMGGGTPVLEANRLGCNVIGCDINPMAHWIVEREIAHLNIKDYRLAAANMMDNLRRQVGTYYVTNCSVCGNKNVPVKYFLWVKTLQCEQCGNYFDLFPGYTLSTNKRHPRYVLICSNCGELNEVENHRHPGKCQSCHLPLKVAGPARNNRCICPHCSMVNRYLRPTQGPPAHRMVALEYYCPNCKQKHQGRFFKKPDKQDLLRYEQASKQLAEIKPTFIPSGDIPLGDETTRLHRWGYRKYSELFNPRQLLGLELSCKLIADLPDSEVKAALATNLSDLLRYQNMLCRYDTRALKSLDIFSVHGFPVGLIQCESNLLGIRNERRGSNIGSGGWSNIIEKYTRAKEFCQNPFEIKHINNKKLQVPIIGEWIGNSTQTQAGSNNKTVQLHCCSSTDLKLAPGSLDAVFTDPPYFGNVQYAELMDFCYVWLRNLVGTSVPGFHRSSTRDKEELTGNNTMERGLVHFQEGMTQVFCNMAQALKPGSPFVFTYHHNDINAYLPVAVALLDAGLVCSASLPCPGEMGASIHINGTGSSIIDTVFVCRSTGVVSRRSIASTAEGIAALVRQDLSHLESGGVTYTEGDMRCITYGHLIRLAIWHLYKEWIANEDSTTKMSIVDKQIQLMGGWPGVREHLLDNVQVPKKQNWVALEAGQNYWGEDYEISF